VIIVPNPTFNLLATSTKKPLMCVNQDYYEKWYQNRLIENIKRRAKQFGYELKYIKEQQPVMKVADG